MPDPVTLAVLAGGESRRMGTPKAMLHLHGKPILSRLLDQLAWPGPTMVVTAPGREKPTGHELFDVEAVDPVAGQGPLRGVLTATEHALTPFVVVIPVDMPGLETPSLLLLAASLQTQSDKSLAMFQRQGGFVEPLPAAFSVQPALGIIQGQLARGQWALRDLPKVLGTSLLQIPDAESQSLWVNLNRPGDVEDYLNTIRIGTKP